MKRGKPEYSIGAEKVREKCDLQQKSFSFRSDAQMAGRLAGYLDLFRGLDEPPMV